MGQKRQRGIVISSYQHIDQVLKRHDVGHVISILGETELEMFPWPSFGKQRVIRLKFDDVTVSSGRFVAPTRQHVADLIDFAKEWSGEGVLLCHCRAGVSRSAAAGLIAAATVFGGNHEVLIRAARPKMYHRANETMVKHADVLLGLDPGLVGLMRSLPPPDRKDDWGPAFISLG